MKYKIVEIEWYDAYVPDINGAGYWKTKEEVLEDKAEVCSSVGYVIGQDDNWISIAQSEGLYEDADIVGGAFRIPSKWIKQLRELH